MTDSHAETRRDAEIRPVVVKLTGAAKRGGIRLAHDEAMLVLARLAELEQAERERDERLTRESGLALIEDAQRWQRAYERERDSVPALVEHVSTALGFVKAVREHEDVAEGCMACWNSLADAETELTAALTVYEQSQGNTE